MNDNDNENNINKLDKKYSRENDDIKGNEIHYSD